jgi:beta-glucosidase-like glycosyl hydrolase
MPGGSYMGDKLAALVKAGTVPMSKVNDSTMRILTPMFEMKLFDIPNNNTQKNNVTVRDGCCYFLTLHTYLTYSTY